jgi:hypothetical protein
VLRSLSAVTLEDLLDLTPDERKVWVAFVGNVVERALVESANVSNWFVRLDRQLALLDAHDGSFAPAFRRRSLERQQPREYRRTVGPSGRVELRYEERPMALSQQQQPVMPGDCVSALCGWTTGSNVGMVSIQSGDALEILNMLDGAAAVRLPTGVSAIVPAHVVVAGAPTITAGAFASFGAQSEPDGRSQRLERMWSSAAKGPSKPESDGVGLITRDSGLHRSHLQVRSVTFTATASASDAQASSLPSASACEPLPKRTKPASPALSLPSSVPVAELNEIEQQSPRTNAGELVDSGAGIGILGQAIGSGVVATILQEAVDGGREVAADPPVTTMPPPASLEQLEIVTVSVDCSICLEPAGKNGSSIAELPCAHRLCALCLDDMLKISRPVDARASKRDPRPAAICPECRWPGLGSVERQAGCPSNEERLERRHAVFECVTAGAGVSICVYPATPPSIPPSPPHGSSQLTDAPETSLLMECDDDVDVQARWHIDVRHPRPHKASSTPSTWVSLPLEAARIGAKAARRSSWG